jgi:hypothetical protein
MAEKAVDALFVVETVVVELFLLAVAPVKGLYRRE